MTCFGWKGRGTYLTDFFTIKDYLRHASLYVAYTFVFNYCTIKDYLRQALCNVTPRCMYFRRKVPNWSTGILLRLFQYPFGLKEIFWVLIECKKLRFSYPEHSYAKIMMLEQHFLTVKLMLSGWKSNNPVLQIFA